MFGVFGSVVVVTCFFLVSMSNKIKGKNIKFVAVMGNGGSHALIVMVLMLILIFTVQKVCGCSKTL